MSIPIQLRKIMALDVGEKTIGIAFSDTSQTIALPHSTLWRSESTRKDMATLRKLADGEDICEIVVGLPLLPDGRHGIQAEKVVSFIATLRRFFRIPITTQDERYTTWDAEQVLIDSRPTPQAQKEVVDALAASLILRDYLATIAQRTRSPLAEKPPDEGA